MSLFRKAAGLFVHMDDAPTAGEPKVDQAQLDELLAEAGVGSDEATAPVEHVPPNQPPPAIEGVNEHTTPEEIYTKAGVPTAPYSAEKMLRVLDKMDNMDPATRKAAVTAMDEADDNWEIGDVLIDARNKAEALEAAITGLGDTITSVQTGAESALAEKQEYIASATALLDEKIAELQIRRQEEVDKNQQECAEIMSTQQERTQACLDEQESLRNQARLLKGLFTIFGEPTLKQDVETPVSEGEVNNESADASN